MVGTLRMKQKSMALILVLIFPIAMSLRAPGDFSSVQGVLICVPQASPVLWKTSDKHHEENLG